MLLTRRWLGALALAAAFCVVAFFLGRWQWHRYEAKDASASLIESHYDDSPVPLRSVLPQSSSPLPAGREWTPVTAHGRYDAASLLLVRNRPDNGSYGYEVLVPLRLQGGGTLLVDRGWVPIARTARARPEVPATPGGRVTVTGWLREGEPSLHRAHVPGQLASINLDEAAAQLGRPVLRAYLIMKHEQAAPGRTIHRPQPLEQPDTSRGPHLAYTIQWWVMAPAGFVLVFVWVRREAAARDEDEGGAAPRGAGPRPAAPARARKPKKVRIWDEEDW